MTTVEKIAQHLQSLPEPAQQEILDFVEFLKLRRDIPKDREENAMWTDLSLASAMRGMESEDSSYALTDIKESFK
jgi:hypothetical protein